MDNDKKEICEPTPKSLISLNDAASILGVSTATIRNWVRTGKIKQVLRSRRRVLLTETEIFSIKDNLNNGSLNLLRTRRNKSSIKGNAIPKEYVSYQPYREITEKILELGSNISDKTLILLELCLKLLHSQGKITLEPGLTEYKGKLERPSSLTEALVNGQLDLDLWESIIRELYDFQIYRPKEEDYQWLAAVNKIKIPFVEGEDFLGLVYTSLSCLGKRKTSGVYYTPHDLAKSLVSQSLSWLSMEAVLFENELKFIDPCCGTGNFLIHLYSSLKEAYLLKGMDLSAIEQRLLEEILYGFDVDPIALALAKINLILLVRTSWEHPPFFKLKVQNTLLSFAWDSQPGKFDLVIGNPPWGSNFRRNELKAFRKKYISAGGTMEAFALFTELGIRLLKAGGVLAFVLPESILNVRIHQGIRQLILTETKIREISLLGHKFSSVSTPAITLILSKHEPARYSEGGSETDIVVQAHGESRNVKQNSFGQNNFCIFNVQVGGKEEEILEYMRTLPGTEFLKNQADFALGIVTGDNKRYVLPNCLPEGEVVLKGNDIFKYNYRPGQNYIIFKPELFQQVAPVAFYRQPEKLIYRFINKHLVFAFDDQQRLTLNSANILIPKIPRMSTKYVLAILNSRPVQFFHTNSFSSIKVLRQHIEAIPIPTCTDNVQEKIIALVDQLILSKDKDLRRELYEEIDRIVMSLYKFDSADKNIIQKTCGEPKYL